MNIFLPEKDLYDSIIALDDRRLIKQILECDQILKVGMYVSLAYSKHPVVEHYKKYPMFVAYYELLCCNEYKIRFGKRHVYENKAKMQYEYLTEQFDNRKLQYPFCDKFIYVEYPKNDPRCIRETDTDKVIELFRQKLCKKWDNDEIPPKWTNRNKPVWYENKKEVK